MSGHGNLGSSDFGIKLEWGQTIILGNGLRDSLFRKLSLIILDIGEGFNRLHRCMDVDMLAWLDVDDIEEKPG